MLTSTLPFVPMRPDQITPETQVGRVFVSARIENVRDLWDAQQGLRADDDVRRIEVDEALVDTGCTMVGLPTSMIQRLELSPMFTRPIRTAQRLGITTVYGTVRLTIQDRDCTTDVFEVSDESPVLIGQVPLELLDFVIDPRGQRLIGNPAHGGEWMSDMF